LEVTGFQNAKEQVGFCGIWCGSCPAGNGAIIELTRRYEESVRDSKLEKWAPKGFDFKEFTKGLALIQTMPLCLGCKKGGGPPTCRIRICALGKGVIDCSQCAQLVECRNFEQLEKTLPNVKGHLMKIKNANRKELIEGWMSELKTKWPHCILLCTSIKK